MKGSDTPNTFSFSPDGRKIAIHVSGKVQIVDRDTRATRVAYTGEGPARKLVWSPDGKWVAFRESRNELVSVDPPAVNFGWALFAVNVETKKVHEFPPEVYKHGEYCYTPEVLGWTKDSKNLALSVPEYTGKPRPDDMRNRLVLCPLAGGKGVPVADITSRTGAVAWMPQ